MNPRIHLCTSLLTLSHTDAYQLQVIVAMLLKAGVHSSTGVLFEATKKRNDSCIDQLLESKAKLVNVA